MEGFVDADTLGDVEKHVRSYKFRTTSSHHVQLVVRGARGLQVRPPPQIMRDAFSLALLAHYTSSVMNCRNFRGDDRHQSRPHRSISEILWVSIWVWRSVNLFSRCLASAVHYPVCTGTCCSPIWPRKNISW